MPKTFVGVGYTFLVLLFQVDHTANLPFFSCTAFSSLVDSPVKSVILRAGTSGPREVCVLRTGCLSRLAEPKPIPAPLCQELSVNYVLNSGIILNERWRAFLRV